MEFVTLFFAVSSQTLFVALTMRKSAKKKGLFLSQQIHTHRAKVSQFLPKIRFYMRAPEDFKNDIISMMAYVQVKQNIKELNYSSSSNY